MRIAIIGSGNVGRALCDAATKAGHDVVLTASDPDTAAEVAARTDAESAPSNAEAVQDCELVILAVPYAAAGSVVDDISEAAAGKVIIDSTNPLNAAYSDLETVGTSAAEQLQQRAGAASVVKAFNTIFAGWHADPSEDGIPLDAFYAGDDPAAKAKVRTLCSSLGYRPIDAGGLRMARSLEEMAFLNIMLNARNEWPWQTAWKLVGPTSS